MVNSRSQGPTRLARCEAVECEAAFPTAFDEQIGVRGRTDARAFVVLSQRARFFRLQEMVRLCRIS